MEAVALDSTSNVVCRAFSGIELLILSASSNDPTSALKTSPLKDSMSMS